MLAFRQLLTKIVDNDFPMPSISFAYGETLTLQEIYDNLVESMDMIFQNAIRSLSPSDRNSEQFARANALFGNDEGLPDGSAIYGIILNSFSIGVHGFGDAENIGSQQGRNILIQDVDIKDLALKVTEIPAIEFNACFDEFSDGISRGPFGDVMDITKMIDPQQVSIVNEFGDLSSLEYIGNVLSDAQIALYLYGDEYSFGSYISPYLLQWAVEDFVFEQDDTGGLLPSCTRFVCNADIMFHTNKGLCWYFVKTKMGHCVVIC